MLHSHQEKRRGRGVHDSSQILFCCLSHWLKTHKDLSLSIKAEKSSWVEQTVYESSIKLVICTYNLNYKVRASLPENKHFCHYLPTLNFFFFTSTEHKKDLSKSCEPYDCFEEHQIFLYFNYLQYPFMCKMFLLAHTNMQRCYIGADCKKAFHLRA